MIKFIQILLAVFAIIFFSKAGIASEDGPVMMLIEAKGSVFYSADGHNWKEIYRNKFLFENWRVKTGHDGTCIILNRQTEMIEPVGADTEIVILSEGIKVVKGTVSESEPAKNLAGYFKRKFTNVQKYTGIRRGNIKNENIRLSTAEDITLSDDYPEMVWENAGSEYYYQLIVGKKIFHVPGTKGDMIRFRLTGMTPGNFQYAVQILYDGEILYAPKKNNALKWLSDAEKSALHKEEQEILKIAPNNWFLMGNLMDEHGLKVSAMDHYRKFLSENPDADEIRPFLIKVLNELKLGKLEKAEMDMYHNRKQKKD